MHGTRRFPKKDDNASWVSLRAGRSQTFVEENKPAGAFHLGQKWIWKLIWGLAETTTDDPDWARNFFETAAACKLELETLHSLTILTLKSVDRWLLPSANVSTANHRV